jgi:hypothetical protein
LESAEQLLLPTLILQRWISLVSRIIIMSEMIINTRPTLHIGDKFPRNFSDWETTQVKEPIEMHRDINKLLVIWFGITIYLFPFQKNAKSIKSPSLAGISDVYDINPPIIIGHPLIILRVPTGGHLH